MVDPAELQALARLEKEHSEADELHATADRLYCRWIASGSLSGEDWRALLLATRRLENLYAAHIQVEENLVFPHAAAVLDAEAIAAIGSEFRSRRSRSGE